MVNGDRFLNAFWLTLACAALLWAWSDEATLLDRFAAARQVATAALGLEAQAAATYQAFLKLLRAWTAALVPALADALRRRMRHDLAERFTHEQAVSAIVVSYYWHFVDVVWIGLFATIYLIQLPAEDRVCAS